MGALTPALHIVPGAEVAARGRRFIVTHVLDLNAVVAQDPDTGKIEKLAIRDLTVPVETPKPTETRELVAIEDNKWDEARRRLALIKPLLDQPRRPRSEVERVAADAGVHAATLYRWINLYEAIGKLSALLPTKRDGGRGKGRLPNVVELIIKETIDDFYLQKQQRSIQATCDEVLARCRKAKVRPPAPNTVRNRIAAIADKVRLERRSNRKVARDLFSARPDNFTEAQWPLSIIQIDHTKLDVIVVDEVHRKPVGRPWITLAIDVYSRMVVGFYVSLDPPGALSTGLCISHAILPKDIWLAKHGIKNAWPCWGIPRQIHADNAKEFRGLMLQRACEEYGIELNYRPIKTPHFGGHIERMLGTLLGAIHGLSGTTFSNPKKRAEYNSDAQASMTIAELEAWLGEYITGVYHQKLHSGIGVAPIKRYEEGILGDGSRPGVGLPARVFDDEKLRLDFMPYVERTIQSYGVLIDDIHYYSDVLRPYINVSAPDDKRRKRQFIFKRDPRDISVVYFYDPELARYSAVPYRNTGYPAMSVWELREIKSKLEEAGQGQIDERAIFDTYERLREHEERAVKQTRHVRRMSERRRNRPVIPKPVQTAANFPPKAAITPFEELEEL